MTRRARRLNLTFFAAVVGVFVVVISARLLLVAGIPRTATADPKASAPTGTALPADAPKAAKPARPPVELAPAR